LVKAEVKHPIIDAVLAAVIVAVLPESDTPVPLTEVGVIGTKPEFACKVVICAAVRICPDVNVWSAMLCLL
jgi:hypothetical protein